MHESFISNKITIQAPVQEVWKVLVEKQYNKQWIDEFSGGNVVTEDWQLNSNVAMTDDQGTVLMVGTITGFEPDRRLKLEFKNSGYSEELTLTAKGDITLLASHAGPVGQAEYNQHSEVWEKGLNKIKALSERL